MKTSLLACTGALLIAGSSYACATPPVCSLAAVVPQEGRFALGKMMVTLGEPDSNEQPSAWQGPLRAGSCSFDIGIIEQPIAITPAAMLYVSTYSGSQRSIALYDLKSCTVRWQSDTFEGKLELNSSELRMGGKTLALDDSCVPVSRASGRRAGNADGSPGH